MAQVTRAPIDEVHAAFTKARGRARHVPTVVLRGRVRLLKRQHPGYDDPRFHRLCAYRHALADRNVRS